MRKGQTKKQQKKEMRKFVKDYVEGLEGLLLRSIKEDRTLMFHVKFPEPDAYFSESMGLVKSSQPDSREVSIEIGERGSRQYV